jgi:lipopolysaccharide/colanic/teichoic acid biosynthesis glycosyltransferase
MRLPRRGAADPALPIPPGTELALPPLSLAQRCYAPLRRVFDLSATTLLLIVAGPIMALVAIVVRLTSRGPAFYTQVRTGRGGHAFTIYKIRTMVDNCESLTGPRWTIPGDPRITAIGWVLRRTHLDELPQLFNVLKGEMSLIGPRPERPEFVATLERILPGYAARHAVLPGITGLAQVQLPPDTDIESVRNKLEYDLYFVRHWGLLLDVRICLATALHICGLSFALLRKLRIIPSPTATEPAPLLRRHAA